VSLQTSRTLVTVPPGCRSKRQIQLFMRLQLAFVLQTVNYVAEEPMKGGAISGRSKGAIQGCAAKARIP